MKDKRLLERLEQSLKTVGAQSRDKISISGFDVFIDPASDAYHLSFAVPLDKPEGGWDKALEAMKTAFAERNRRARLEYFHELYPDLAGALKDAGFNQDMRAPVMTLQGQDLAEPAESDGSYLELRPEHSNRLESYLRRQSFCVWRQR